MKELISLYDNFLIYYPNYFFSSLFFLITFLFIFFVATISLLPIRKGRKKFTEVKINFLSIKTIVFNAPYAIGFVISDKINKLSKLYISNINRLAKSHINKINKLAIHINSKVETEIKKIAKAILINE